MELKNHYIYILPPFQNHLKTQCWQTKPLGNCTSADTRPKPSDVLNSHLVSGLGTSFGLRPTSKDSSGMKQSSVAGRPFAIRQIDHSNQPAWFAVTTVNVLIT